MEGKGWEAVALTDRVVENMLMKRADAERHDDEILGSVAPWIWGADEFDLDTVDPELISEDERHLS